MRPPPLAPRGATPLERLGRWIVRWRVPILIATLALMAGAALLMPRVRIDASSRNLLFSASAERQAFLRFARRWGSDRLLLLAVEAGERGLFRARELRYLQALTDRLGALPEVERVESLTSASVLGASGETLLVQPVVPRPVPTDPAALARIRSSALASPLLRRLLVDEAGRMAAVNLRLRYDEDDPEVLLGAVRAVRRALLGLPRPAGTTTRLVGAPVLMEAADRLIHRDVWVLTLAPLLLVGLFLGLCFRSARGVLLPLATVSATALTTFGALIASGHAINLVTSMLPSLVMVIGVADAVHVLVAHREATSHGDPRQAAITAVARVGLPCLLTSLTTAVGFGSLALSEIAQVREFGLFAALGVLMALVFALISLPALLACLPAPAPRSGADGARRPDWIARRLVRLASLYGRLRIPALIGAVALVVVGAAGLPRLRVESSVVTYLPADHPVHADLTAVEPRLSGTVPVVIHLWDRTAAQTARAAAARRATRATPTPTPAPAAGVERLVDPEDDTPAPRIDADPAAGAPQPERLRDPAVLAAIDELAVALQRVPGVRKVVSVTEYLKEVNRVMRGGGLQHHRLPTDRRVIATYLELIAGQDADALDNLISADRSAANVTILTTAHGSAELRRILAAIDAELARPSLRAQLGEHVAVDVTGLGPLLASVADRIVIGQLRSCFLALAVIGLLFVLLLWSLRTALVALLPNVLPILLTVGLMGWLGVSLNVTTVMIASIALGIAVDDTIHMLVRTRRQVRLHGDYQAALRQTLASAGQAIVITTVVVAGGFLVLLLASLIPARHFGLLTALTMLVALAADLILLPVLILWLRPWRAASARSGRRQG